MAQYLTYNRLYHRFVTFAACGTFLLIVAGALVTSNDAGLAVPDWPTSFGSLYRIPPMVGGVKFEHAHRMVAECIGLITIIVAVWTWCVEYRSWMRKLGLVALATVIAQGILGGLTVLYFLPAPVSSAHATLAQTFFCILVAMTVVSGRDWITGDIKMVPDRGQPSLRTLAVVSVALVYLQLILGAAFRHSGIKLLPHLISAGAVTAVLLWTITRVLSQHGSVPQLRRPAIALLILLFLQLSLGLGSYLARIEWSKDAPQPMLSMVIITVAHVAVGALLLASTVVLAIHAFHHTATQSAPRLARPPHTKGALA